jgi:N12 class adenine-specific DNA methylase
MNLTEARAKIPGLEGMNDATAFKAIHSRFYADMDPAVLAAKLNYTPEPAKTAPRSWGQAASDVGRAAAAGVGGVVKGAGTLYGLVTGDMENGATELGDSVQDYWTQGQSQQLKDKSAARSGAIDAADGQLSKAGVALWETVTDPALAMDAVAGSMAALVPGMAAGRLAAGVSAARGLAAASKTGPASAVAREAIAKSAGSLGTKVAIGTGAVQQGADVTGGVYKAAMNKPDSAWMENAEFMAEVAKTDLSLEAIQATKHTFALAAARATMPAATAISVAANAIPGANMLERALVGGGAREVAKAGASWAIPKAMAKAGLGEMAQEAIEEGGGAFAGNVAKQHWVDPEQDLGEKVGENAGMGAAGGLLMGGAGGTFHGHASNAAADPATTPAVDPLAAVRTAAQQPGSVLARAALAGSLAVGSPAAVVNPGASQPVTAPASALTPEQIEAEVARLDAAAARAPATGDTGLAAVDPIADTQAQIDAGLAQAAKDKAAQRAAGAPAAETEADPMQAQADEVVKLTRTANVSTVQRHLKIGYNRAARLLENMERSGLVSPRASDGTRQVLQASEVEPPMPETPASTGANQIAPLDSSTVDISNPASPPRYSLFDSKTYQDGDVHGAGGQPFNTEGAAKLVLKKHPGATLEQFSNGFVIRRPNAADASRETAGTAPVQPQEAVNGAITPPAGLDQPAAATPVDQHGGSREPALDAVPAGGWEPGNAGITTGGTEPGAAVVDAGSGAGAVAPKGELVATGMFMRVAGKDYPVDSFEQASDMRFQARKEAERQGRAGLIEDPVIMDAAGRVLGYVGQGDSIYAEKDADPRSRKLYDAAKASLNNSEANATPAPAAIETVANAQESQAKTRLFPSADNLAAADKYKTTDNRSSIEQFESGRDSVKSMDEVRSALDSQPALESALSARLQEAHKAHGRDVKRSMILRAINGEKADQTGTPAAKRERQARIARLEADLSLFDQPANEIDQAAHEAATSQEVDENSRARIGGKETQYTDVSKIKSGRVRQLEAGAAPLHEPQGQALEGLRREGDQDGGGVGQQFSTVLSRHGDQAESVAFAGQNQYERGLLTGELPLGDSRAAGSEQAVLPPTGYRWRNTDNSTGRTPPWDEANNLAQQDFGAGSVSGAGQNTGEGSFSEGFKASDAQWGNAQRPGMGEVIEAQAEDATGAIAKGDAVGEGAATRIEKSANEAELNPTPAQIDAGNYRLGHIKVHGLAIAIENPKGSTRSGVSPDGTKWSNTMGGHYGYFKGTTGNDGDHVDTYVGPNPESRRVFVIDQVNQDGSFDEHKSMIGYDSPEQARESYLSSFMPGWTGLGAMTELPVDAFKSWVKDGKKKQPLGEIAGVNKAQVLTATAQAAIENVAPAAQVPAVAAAPVKWFGTKDKAGAHLIKNKLTKTHEVVPAGKGRFEVREKAGATSTAPTVAPTNHTVESVARAIQIKVAQNRRKFREANRVKRSAKGYAPNSTPDSEQADYDEEISKEPGDVQKNSAANLIGTDPEALIGMFTKGSYEASEDVFRDLTGVKIRGLSVKDKKAALYKWAKWTPEQIAASEQKAADREAARTDGFKQDDLESAVSGAWRGLERLKVKNNDGNVTTGQEFILSMVADGFDKAHTQKKGAITVYGLTDGGRFTSLKNKDANAFLKAAIEFGGLDKALSFVEANKVPAIEEYQAPTAEQVPTASAAPAVLDVSGKTRAEVLTALESGQRVAREGTTTWIEETKAGKVSTYVIKSKDDDSMVAFTKGPAGADRQWGWGRSDAAQKAVESWSFADSTTATPELTDLTQARNLLIQLQAKQDAKGMVGDDRLETQINQIKREIKAMEVAEGQNDELDAEMRSYEAKANPTYSGEPAKAPAAMPGAQNLDKRIKSDVAKKQAEAPVAPPAAPKEEAKPDALVEKEKAAKAKMLGALGKLAALASKNTRMNWTPEEEQQLLPIVIELFDGALELGAVTFQKAVRYVREFISNGIDQETADAIPFETLQGAYIHTARKYKDQGATTGKEVMSFDSLAELENSAEKADTDTKDTTNDSTEPTDPPALNRPLDEGQRPAGSKSPARGAKSSRSGSGRANDGGVRSGGKRVNGESSVGEEPAGSHGESSSSEYGPVDSVAGGGKRVSAPDFIPGNGGLTREGSWFETAKRNIDLIELAIQIEKEGRPATADEQAQLAKYVGFGASEIRNALFPIPPAYAKIQDPTRLIWPNMVREARWKPLAERMDALPREWQQTILQSSQYAHYTSEGIIRSVWSAIERLGFTGGKVFEPGMGIGSFAMLMPENVRSTSRYTGVEFDAPTALIARLLSPQQHMLHGDFIKRTFPKNFFDVNVGNPPFSQTKVLGDPNYEKHGFMLHDFFFAKGIDLVRPGGLQVFVTSKGTMDKQTDKARKYLSERADLLGAIRLPSTAFEGNAGTSVVTDVIFLRKRLPGEAPAGEAWNNTATIETQDGPTVVNEYFAKHPEMVLGQQRISGNMDDAGRRINSNGMGGEKYTVVSYDTTPAELDAKFAKAIENLPENAYSIMSQSADSLKAETAKVDFDPSIKREGVVYLGKDGAIMRVESGMGKPLDSMVKLSDKDKAWFKGYVGLRDAVQLARQAQHTDGNWEAALKKLNKVYDQFRKEHGPIIDFRVQVRKSTDEDGNVVETESRIFKNNRLLREDYDRAILTALESISESGEIIKAPFLTGRTIGKPVTREVRSIGDALAVSLDEVGSLNMEDVARRMKISPSEAIEALGSQIYQTPEGVWQLADEYLSGNVVEKLEEAMQAVQHDPSLKRNVEALKEAQPEKLGPSQISAKLGASWVPAAHVNEFAKLIEAGTVTFDSKTETWQVDGGNLRSQRKAGAEYGTAQRSPSELLEAALNSRTVKVMQTIDKKTTIDEAATVAATEAVKKIKDKFKGWIWTDSERATELVESYNRRYNNIAPRKFDGSHLTLPGVSLRFKLHPHQLRAIWRMVQAGNTYLAHAVGAGKTIEMIAGGMEQKRLGLIKKPMYVVPNHMLEQFSNEFMELYPLANIMVADDENFSADRRKAFIASATLNNPDAIVITHDAFQRIGVKEESVAPIRDEILADLEIELSETAKDQGARVRRGQLEQQIEAVKQRFDRIIGAGGKDSTIKFEDMGVDFVFADESHAFRKLDFHTAQQIKGIDPNGSKRAMDMYVKTRILDKQRPGRAFVFASGTPVTNTMGELYTIMRFFAAEELDRAGISTFDAWARQFGEVAPALEPNAAGKYEMVERFAKFDNVPELMSRVRQFMDVLTSDSLGALVKRPDLKGGKPNLNIVPSNPALETYMKGELARRIEVSKAWKPSKDQPHNPDPIVSIITDGRFAAIDPRFFGALLPEGSASIITEMGAKVVEGYKAHRDNVYLDKNGKPEPIKGGTQIVFYNLGFGEGAQKSRGFNARAAFTKILTDGGIPRAEIAWFDDANTDAKKEAVFKDMRSGKLKVLIGSAKKMGTGVNVQKRLAELHYQDPPWFPADVEQPHGRIIRQGNQNSEVAIEWYTTKGTYQSTMWQMVGRKQRFIDQAFTGDKTLRSMGDLGEASLFEQAAAVASGDPRAIQLAGLKQEVERFERLQAAHASEQVSVSTALRYASYAIESAQGRIKKYSTAFKAIGESYFSFTTGKVGAAEFNKQGEFGQAIKAAFNKSALEAAQNPATVMPEQVLATLGHGITVTMEGSEDKGKPTGWFDLAVHFGGENLSIYHAESLGADVDATGLARRIINQINSVEVDLRRARADLLTNETDTARLRKKLGAPFEYQQEMAEKYGDLKRLEDELRAEGEAKPEPGPQGITADGEIGSSSLNLQSPPPLGFKRQPPVMFSRQATPTRGTPVPRVQAVVDAITSQWANAPEVVVVSDMQDAKVPQKVREADQLQKSQGAQGEPDGFIYKGTVYLVAAELPTINDVVRVLMHEAGHAGLRGAFGDALTPILNQVATMRRADIVAKAREYGLLNPATPLGASVNEQWQAMSERDRREAAEEVLAVMAQTQPELGFVKRAVAAIRNWLRTHVPGFKSLAMTDVDIVQAFILPARRHIVGKQASSTAKNTSLEAIAQRESNLLDLIACLG